MLIITRQFEIQFTMTLSPVFLDKDAVNLMLQDVKGKIITKYLFSVILKMCSLGSGTKQS